MQYTIDCVGSVLIYKTFQRWSANSTTTVIYKLTCLDRERQHLSS